jgi:uncharacterized protein YjbJ (UPF0337 family)
MKSDGGNGAAEHAKASLKEAIGKITGDAGIEAEGAAEKAQREAQAPPPGTKRKPPAKRA